mgnify:CR=1 FL=1
MPRIQKLPKHEAHKIAAGEVVERPANIVKELLENSIDADATKISLYIEDGGKKLMRIVDNGCGMDRQDALLCFEKHATSKITSVDELDAVQTFGFRGEALASVAAVSQTTLITKQKDSDEGVCLEIAHSEITNEEIVPATTGTDIAVRDLFFNIPARRKFLKKRETEWRHINQLFQAFCLDYPHIHFSLFSEGKSILNCPPAQDIAQRGAQLWDHDTAQHLIPLEGERLTPFIKINGVISDHQTYRYDRNNIFFFVNKRWVKNNTLSRALLKGYQNVIPHGRYPLAALSIEVDPVMVDVNIHPRKEEVKFMHPRMVENLIQEAVKQALEKNLSAHIKQDVAFAHNVHTYGGTSPQPNYNLHQKPQKTISTLFSKIGEAFTSRTTDTQQNVEPLEKINSATSNAQPTTTQSFIAHSTPAEQANTTSTKPLKQTPTKVEPKYRLVGQYKKTYLIIEEPEGLFLLDQHAAHERILYEQFAERFNDIPTVTLLFPELITITNEEKTLIEPHLSIFQQNGIGIELFDDTQLIVRSTPVHLKDASIEELIKKMVAEIEQMDTVDEAAFFKQAHEKLRAQMACKAAIRAGDTLNQQQMDKLLQDLYKTQNRFSCPHGRPTSWLLRIDEIEKKFKRDYKSHKPDIDV